MKKITSFFIILMLSMVISAMTWNPLLERETVETKINTILNGYSDALMSNNQEKIDHFSQEVENLVIDRKNFYVEFLETGLQIEFRYLESSFDPIIEKNIIKTGNMYSIKTIEKVILHGKSKISSAENYPLVLAANWAIENVEDGSTKTRLNNYLENMINSVNDSLNEDIKIELILKHNLRFEEKNGSFSLLSDEFDDKSIENNEGTDVVIFVDGVHRRLKPDFTKNADYLFFHTPIETLGNQLIADYMDLKDKKQWH